MQIDSLRVSRSSVSGDTFPARIALLGNFPPRQCGIATYTQDSLSALLALENPPQVDVYVMDDGKVSGYGDDIAMLIPDGEASAYRQGANAINASGAEILWIQHEFGIFGGEAGGYLLDLTDALDIPFAVSLHTVIEAPNPAQRHVMRRLVDGASAIIVMAEKGREILESIYGADPRKISVIPHGAPDRPLEPTADAKSRLSLAQRPTVLTFGLLSPGKGIEDMIRAVAEIVPNVRDVSYIVLGATHPHLRSRDGEAYRDSLIALAETLGVSDNVSFVDRYTSLGELLEWLAAADVYVTPYLNPAQIVSGTLSYAVALGKPVVSTPYSHAMELLADGHGMLVPFASPTALASAVTELLTDETKRSDMAQKAYARGRATIWSCNASAVMNALASGQRLQAEIAKRRPVRLAQPIIRLSSIDRLTDGTGMLQHSIGGIADRRHGYCIDDNARALMLVALADDLPVEKRLSLFATYASFVQHAWNPDIGSFRNFMGFDRAWLEDAGSEDSNGRTLWTLGVAARHAPTAAHRNWAKAMFHISVSSVGALTSPRTRAFAMLGAAEILAMSPADGTAWSLLRDGTALLMRLLEASRRPDWHWFEVMLAYDNCRLPEALIRAGMALGDKDAIACGLDTLDWISQQTVGPDGEFRPVGTASFGRAFAAPAVFDQQPLEAWAMIDACEAAFLASGDPVWHERAKSGHDWFLGANTLREPMIDTLNGECFDGLTPFGVNINHGAESVLAWHLAHRKFRKMAAAQPPAAATQNLQRAVA